MNAVAQPPLPIPRSLEGWGDVLARLPSPMRRKVTDAYITPLRCYHSARHVGGIWQTHLTLGGDPADQAVLWAAAYHDLIYDVGAPKGRNEERSAMAFAHAVWEHGLDKERAAEAAVMILATADHMTAREERSRYFCDLDLAGFAADRETYEESTRLLRLEFRSVGEPQWQKGRAAFLRGLRDQTIFRSQLAPKEWEERAQENIRLDLAEIGG